MVRRLWMILVLSAFANVVHVADAQADIAFHVIFSPATIEPGTYYLDFQLNDGDGAGPNNTARIVNLTSASPLGSPGVPPSVGAFTGDPSSLSGLEIRDAQPINEFAQQFTPGGGVEFDVFLTTHADAGVPDQFSFALLNAALDSVETTAFNSSFFYFDIFPVTTLADAQVFGSLSGSVPAPVLIPIQADNNVAEPASVVLVLSALLFRCKAAMGEPGRA